jgi:hypothetical protein
MDHQIPEKVYLSRTGDASGENRKQETTRLPRPTKSNRLLHFFLLLGPGLISGAADDDPPPLPPILSPERNSALPFCGPHSLPGL